MNLDSEERAILGAILVAPDQTLALCDKHNVESMDFIHPVYRGLFYGVEAVRWSGNRVDPVSLAGQVPEEIVEQIDFCIDNLPKKRDNTYNLDNVGAYIDKLVERRIVKDTRQILEEYRDKIGREDDTRAQVREVAAKLLTVSRDIAREATKEEKIDEIVAFWSDGEIKDGRLYKSRWEDLDNLIAGWRTKGMYLLGARPSDGKTCMMKNEFLHQALQGTPVAINCPDTTEEILWQRIVAELSGLNSHRLNRQQNITDADRISIRRAAETAKELPIFISDRRMSFEEFYVWLAGLVSTEEVRFVGIDYIQLMRTKGNDDESRSRQLGELAYDLKDTFKEMDVVGLVLSQLRRLGSATATDSLPPPALETLRDSGELEQAADTTLMLYKEPGLNLREVFTLDNDWPMELSVEKNKEGPTGQLGFYFVRSKQIYMTPDEHMFRNV